MLSQKEKKMLKEAIDPNNSTKSTYHHDFKDDGSHDEYFLIKNGKKVLLKIPFLDYFEAIEEIITGTSEAGFDNEG